MGVKAEEFEHKGQGYMIETITRKYVPRSGVYLRIMDGRGKRRTMLLEECLNDKRLKYTGATRFTVGHAPIVA